MPTLTTKSDASAEHDNETCDDNNASVSPAESIDDDGDDAGDDVVVNDELAAALSQLVVTKSEVDDDKKNDDDTPSIPASILQLAEWITEKDDGKPRRVLVLTGAGVSVAAGIPDFRTPGTGLYDNLQQYDLPFPEAVFDVDFYAQNPTPFCTLAKEIWPADKKATPTAESSPSSNSGTKGSATDASSTSKSPAVVALPTLTHSFIALLAAKGLLLRNYSQNIDGLEFLAGLDPELLVECHGHFRTASCIGCGSSADPDGTKESILHRGEPPRCKVKGCESWVKPDIVFFGEGLPSRFHRLLKKDLPAADLLLVLGTSLQVAPVSLIPQQVRKSCKRCLINRDAVGPFGYLERTRQQKRQTHPRDLFCSGNCDDTIVQLATALGWKDELLKSNSSTKEALLSPSPLQE